MAGSVTSLIMLWHLITIQLLLLCAHVENVTVTDEFADENGAGVDYVPTESAVTEIGNVTDDDDLTVTLSSVTDAYDVTVTTELAQTETGNVTDAYYVTVGTELVETETGNVTDADGITVTTELGTADWYNVTEATDFGTESEIAATTETIIIIDDLEGPQIEKIKGAVLHDDKYYINENRTIELIVIAPGNPDSTLTFFAMMKDGSKPPMNVTEQRYPLEDEDEFIRAKLLIEVTRWFKYIQWELVDHATRKRTKQRLNFVVLVPLETTITFNGSAEHNGRVHLINETENFSLLCSGGGVDDFTITWLDASGLPLYSGPNVEIDDQENDLSDRSKPQGGKYLHVLAERGMKSFGCKVTSPSIQAPTVHWFRFQVQHPPNVTLVADTSVCDQVKFVCKTDATYLTKVNYQWTLNGDVISWGKWWMNFNSSETEAELNSVECLGWDNYGNSSSYLDKSEFEISNCSTPIEFEISSCSNCSSSPISFIISGVAVGFLAVLIVILYSLRVYWRSSQSSDTYVYKVVPKSNGLQGPNLKCEFNNESREEVTIPLTTDEP